MRDYTKVKEVEYRDTRKDIWMTPLPENVGELWMQYFNDQMALKKQ